MLTKDLLLCRIERGRVRPRFVNPEDPFLRDVAARLIDLFRGSPPPSRGELADDAAPILNGLRDVKPAKGLFKLLMDRSEFSTPCEADYEELRRTLFRASAAVLKSGNPRLADPDTYRTEVLRRVDLPEFFVTGDIYADLPENEVLARFRELTDRQLLERYNVALVQSLLLTARSLHLKITNPDAAKLRRMMKYLKFFRLLARVLDEEGRTEGERPEDGALVVEIDGPGSLLGQSRKYGLQLACFFPAVCPLDRWELRAEVLWKDKPAQLKLTEAEGLVGHYRNFSAYVPEEVRLFHGHFRQKVDEWRIVGDTPFLRAGGRELIFPDLSFRHDDATVLHLELFHRWHATALRQRLELLRSTPEIPLIVGVDRSLLGKQVEKEELAEDPALRDRTFLFRDYPTVDKTLGCLRKLKSAGS